jgi:hypothetical protein
MLNLNLNTTNIKRGPAGPSPTPVPVVDFSASTTGPTAGDSVTFTDLSTNTPTSWQWEFPGGTPTGSTSQNPTVTYSATGSYNVSLSAGNTGGTGSLTKTNYITVTAPACTSPLISTTSIMGYYKFDGDYTPTLNQAFFGTPVDYNMNAFVSGKFGQAASFNGTSSYLEYGNNNLMEPVYPGGWTLSTWIYIPSGAGVGGSMWDKRVPGVSGQRIVYRAWSATQHNVLITANGQNLGVTFLKPGGTGLDQWIHVAVRLLSGTNRYDVFINGTLEGYVIRTGYTASGQILNVGRDRANNSSHFYGYMDEYQVWDRDLTTTEIQDLAAGTCPLTS